MRLVLRRDALVRARATVHPRHCRSFAHVAFVGRVVDKSTREVFASARAA